MEPRHPSPQAQQESDRNEQDAAEDRGIKQIGILMVFGPVIALLGGLLFLVVPPSFPALRALAVILLLIGLVSLGTWFAGRLSRKGTRSR